MLIDEFYNVFDLQRLAEDVKLTNLHLKLLPSVEMFSIMYRIHCNEFKRGKYLSFEGNLTFAALPVGKHGGKRAPGMERVICDT